MISLTPNQNALSRNVTQNQSWYPKKFEAPTKPSLPLTYKHDSLLLVSEHLNIGNLTQDQRRFARRLLAVGIPPPPALALRSHDALMLILGTGRGAYRNFDIYIYIHIPGTCLSSILVVEPFKKPSFSKQNKGHLDSRYMPCIAIPGACKLKPIPANHGIDTCWTQMTKIKWPKPKWRTRKKT